MMVISDAFTLLGDVSTLYGWEEDERLREKEILWMIFFFNFFNFLSILGFMKIGKVGMEVCVFRLDIYSYMMG